MSMFPRCSVISSIGTWPAKLWSLASGLRHKAARMDGQHSSLEMLQFLLSFGIEVVIEKCRCLRPLRFFLVRTLACARVLLVVELCWTYIGPCQIQCDLILDWEYWKEHPPVLPVGCLSTSFSPIPVIQKSLKSTSIQGTNISHLGKRKIIFKMPWDMSVPRRVFDVFGYPCVRCRRAWKKKAGVLPWDSNTRISRIRSGSSDPRNGKNSET